MGERFSLLPPPLAGRQAGLDQSRAWPEPTAGQRQRKLWSVIGGRSTGADSMLALARALYGCAGCRVQVQTCSPVNWLPDDPGTVLSVLLGGRHGVPGVGGQVGQHEDEVKPAERVGAAGAGRPLTMTVTGDTVSGRFLTYETGNRVQTYTFTYVVRSGAIVSASQQVASPTG
jgi:hypothetical protein